MKQYIVDKNLRIRLGNWGFIKSVLILEKKKKFIFINYWVKIGVTIPRIHNSIEDAAKYLLKQAKPHLVKGDIEKLFK